MVFATVLACRAVDEVSLLLFEIVCSRAEGSAKDVQLRVLMLQRPCTCDVLPARGSRKLARSETVSRQTPCSAFGKFQVRR